MYGSHDGYYDPPYVQEWSALFWCDSCEKDTMHDFWKTGALEAMCGECGRDVEIDPDDFYED